jgi:hypothetical protein
MFTKTFSVALEALKAYIAGWEQSIMGISFRFMG